ncbi:hypothetical protein NL108_011478 [Boleophthalmus pectinirostris]|uniref:uncharacterized protein LOC110157993 n=1 Tax=Boleophthalmus pectinirostris TaxID=150288 RepID=UPI000A1C1A27|nr:uncharacterized protein LOC110157993 [Boleophthalmus pectinirostris]KAJ0064655.1 hypothetical protein NL108_011478 [Boleophthalmus pectinirostris]
MESIRSCLLWLLQVLIRRWFFLFTLFCLYYYHIRLEKDMNCYCLSQARDCRVYLLAPALILTVVQLCVDLVFARGMRYLYGRGQGAVRAKVLPVLIRRVLEASFVGLLWVQSLLLDADWYICCGRGNIRCGIYPYNDIFNQRPSYDEIKNESQVIGLLLVLSMFLAGAILSWLPWERWCSFASSDWSEAVLEEVELTMGQQMRTIAREQLRAKVDQSGADWRKWEELEKELLLSQTKAPTEVQTSVLMSSLTNADGV